MLHPQLSPFRRAGLEPATSAVIAPDRTQAAISAQPCLPLSRRSAIELPPVWQTRTAFRRLRTIPPPAIGVSEHIGTYSSRRPTCCVQSHCFALSLVRSLPIRYCPYCRCPVRCLIQRRTPSSLSYRTARPDSAAGKTHHRVSGLGRYVSRQGPIPPHTGTT